MYILSSLLWILIATTNSLTTPENTRNFSLVYPPDANLLLGVLLPIHSSKSLGLGRHICYQLQNENGIQPLEALMYWLDEVNSDPDLLPGIKLGALVLDSCNSPAIALQQALRFIKGFLANQNAHHELDFSCDDASIPSYRNGEYDKVVGVIAGQQSRVSIQIANILRVIEIPQISYLSTSEALSDRDKYPFFLRTVPSDSNQAEVILQILGKFNWTYVSLVYSATEYGQSGYDEMVKKAPDLGVCFAYPAHRLSRSDSEIQYQKVVDKLLDNWRANVVVVFTDRDIANKLIQAVGAANATTRFVWVASDGWSHRGSKIEPEPSIIEGAIAVEPLVEDVLGFDEHFGNLSLSTNSRNIWFPEYMQQLAGCTLDAQYEGRDAEDNAEGIMQCDPYLTVGDTGKYLKLPWIHFVRDAVYAYAHALHDLWRAKCQEEVGLCQNMAHDGHVHGSDVFEYLATVTFNDLGGRQFRFLDSGAGLPRYTILNFQRRKGNTYVWQPVGSYTITDKDSPELDLDLSVMKYRGGSEFPSSSCGKPCLHSQAKIREDDTCCWRCEDCTTFQYLNLSELLCRDCESCSKPDVSGTMCLRKVDYSSSYKDSWAISAMAFAGLGIFSTVLVAIIFWIYLDTPIIKAASRELSFILLSGIFLSFSMTFAIVAPPSSLSCGFVRFFFGFSYTVCYAAILTKTNRISRIFNKNPAKPHQKARYTSPRSQLIIVVLLVCVEVIINICWLMYHPPGTKLLCNREFAFNILICHGADDYSYIVGFVYPLCLVLLCTVYAIKTRKCPGGFNEARYIAFTNYTTCILWLIFVPLYLSTSASDDVRIVTMAMSLTLGGFVQLVCLFFPKVHIVIFKPEKNTRDAVMSQRPYRHSYSSARHSNIIQQQTTALAQAVLFCNGLDTNSADVKISNRSDVTSNVPPNSGAIGGKINTAFLAGSSNARETVQPI